ncbi:MAG: CHAT domain-containing protein, partial [Bacteroidota bacterium]
FFLLSCTCSALAQPLTPGDEWYEQCKAARSLEEARKLCGWASEAYRKEHNSRRWVSSRVRLATHLSSAAEAWAAVNVLDSAWQEAAWLPEKDQARLHLQHGFFLNEIGQFTRAAGAYEQVLTYHRTAGSMNGSMAYFAAKPLANIYVRQGRYPEARRLLEEAKQLLPPEQAVRWSAVILDLATVASMEHRLEDAHAAYQTLLAAPEVPALRQVQALSNEALLFASENRLAAADRQIQEAISLSQQIEDPTTELGVISIRGDISLQAGNLAAAQQQAQQAYELARELYPQGHRRLGKICLLQAEVAHQQGAWESALWHCQAAFQAIFPSYRPENATDGPAEEDWYVENVCLQTYRQLGGILFTKAQLTSDTTELRHALGQYQKALDMHRYLLNTYAYEADQLSLQEVGHEVISEAMEACWWGYTQGVDAYFGEAAFAFMEQGKALQLFAKWQMAQAFPPAVDTLLGTLRPLQWQIQSLEEQQFQSQMAVGKPEWLKLETQKDSLIQARAKIHTLLRQQIPTLALQSPTELRSQSIQARLDQDQGMLNVHLQDSVLFELLLLPDALMFERKSLPGIEQEIHQFQASLTDYFLQPQRQISLAEWKSTYAQLGHQLYQKLLGSLAASLPERLILLPDGALNLLPFEALLTEPVPLDTYFAHFPYVLAKHSLSIAPSAHWWQSSQQRVPNYHGWPDLLSVAPTYPNDQVFPLPNHVQDSFAFLALPFAEEEVDQLHLLIGGNKLKGEQATKSHFLQEVARYPLIHFAGHGWLEATDSRFSFLAFSPTTGEPEDALLYLSELSSHRLSAELVVLSACETGLGEIWQGEGVNSLSRAFLTSGANSVLTSLWSVSDQNTQHLMQTFYHHLKAGLPKDEALRLAKLKQIEANEPPYFWAAFQLSGQERALDLPNRNKWLGGVLSLLVLVIMGGLIIRRSRQVDNPVKRA